MEFDKEKFKRFAMKYSDYPVLEARINNAFSGWNSQDPSVYFDKIKEVTSVIDDVVDLVEKFSKDVDNLSNREKLELVVESIDDMIKFNWLMEWFDGMAIRMIISTLVQAKNKYLGVDWIKDE